MYKILRFHYLFILLSPLVLSVLILLELKLVLVGDRSTVVDDLEGIIFFFPLVMLLFGQPIIFFLLRFRPDVKISRTAGSYDALLLSILYILIVVWPVFYTTTDPQTNAPVGSLFTRVVGDWTYFASGTVFMIVGILIPLLYLYCFVVFIYELVQGISMEIDFLKKSASKSRY